MLPPSLMVFYICALPMPLGPNCCQYSCQPTLKLSASFSTCWQQNPESIFSFRTKYDIPRPNRSQTFLFRTKQDQNPFFRRFIEKRSQALTNTYVRFPIEHYSLSWSSDSLECLTLLWCISIILPFVGQVAKVWWKSRNVWFNLE